MTKRRDDVEQALDACGGLRLRSQNFAGFLLGFSVFVPHMTSSPEPHRVCSASIYPNFGAFVDAPREST
jgi:hypothetical protein